MNDELNKNKLREKDHSNWNRTLQSVISYVPLTERQRNEIQLCIDKMEEIFRDANSN